jgi:hypothetical protein
MLQYQLLDHQKLRSRHTSVSIAAAADIEASNDYSNFARVLNSSVNNHDTHLEALYDMGGQPVGAFPETGADIGALNGKHLRPRRWKTV